jgi:hypothetical protein
VTRSLLSLHVLNTARALSAKALQDPGDLLSEPAVGFR